MLHCGGAASSSPARQPGDSPHPTPPIVVVAPPAPPAPARPMLSAQAYLRLVQQEEEHQLKQALKALAISRGMAKQLRAEAATRGDSSPALMVEDGSERT